MAEFYGSFQDGYYTSSIVIDRLGIVLYVGAESSGSQDVDAQELHSNLFIDTSELGSDFVVVSAKLYFYIPQVIGDFPPDLDVWVDDGAAGTTLEASDYKKVINAGAKIVRIPGDPEEMLGGWEVNFPSAALSQINKTGYTNVEFDAVWGQPISSSAYVLISSQEESVGYRPKLTVTGYRGINNAELINCEIMATA